MNRYVALLLSYSTITKAMILFIGILSTLKSDVRPARAGAVYPMLREFSNTIVVDIVVASSCLNQQVYFQYVTIDWWWSCFGRLKSKPYMSSFIAKYSLLSPNLFLIDRTEDN